MIVQRPPPSALRMPISRVRDAAACAARPTSPSTAINTATATNTENSVVWRSNPRYMFCTDAAKKVFCGGAGPP